MTEQQIWVSFFIFILTLLGFDLVFLHKKQGQKQQMLKSFLVTGFYIFISLAFAAYVYVIYSKKWIGSLEGGEAASQYLAAYLMEKSLSLDNILVISLIFTAFQVPSNLHHRVLFYGILGVLVMRFIMIVAGLKLLSLFSWIIPVFGVFLIYSAYKILKEQEKAVLPKEHKLYLLAVKKGWLTKEFHEESFFIKNQGKWMATPLLAALVFIESADLLFALDSIPAVFGVTTDPFIVFSSNIFAILGLRSLYFVLSHMVEKFHYLKDCLALLLGFIGIKMAVGHYVSIPTLTTLFIIVTVLGFGIYRSLKYEKSRPK